MVNMKLFKPSKRLKLRTSLEFFECRGPFDRWHSLPQIAP